MSRKWLEPVRGYAAALIGGILGYALAWWLVRWGLYAPLLPGAGVGLGFGLATAQQPLVHRVICGVAGLAAGVYVEWQLFPFIDDRSLGYFLLHLHEVMPLHLVFLVLGGLLAFWLSGGTRRPAPGEPG